jgi:hypothetical protein
MRSRTVIFIPDPFEPRRLPLGVLVEHGGLVIFEPIPLPGDLDAGVFALAGLLNADLRREELHAERLPDSCGPHVMLGPWHGLLTSLPREVFDAIGRATDKTSFAADVEAALEEGRRHCFSLSLRR